MISREAQSNELGTSHNFRVGERIVLLRLESTLQNTYPEIVLLRFYNIYHEIARFRLKNIYQKTARLRLHNIYHKIVKLRLHSIYHEIVSH